MNQKLASANDNETIAYSHGNCKYYYKVSGNFSGIGPRRWSLSGSAKGARLEKIPRGTGAPLGTGL